MAEKEHGKKRDDAIKIELGMGNLGWAACLKAFKTWWTSYPSWKKQAVK